MCSVSRLVLYEPKVSVLAFMSAQL
jgi:hypothetical protein